MKKKKGRKNEVLKNQELYDDSGKEKFSDHFFSVLEAHPFIATFLVCMCIQPFYFGSVNNVPVGTVFIFSLFLTVSIFTTFYFKYLKNTERTFPWTALILTGAVLVPMLMAWWYTKTKYKGLTMLLYGVIFLHILCFYFLNTKKYKTQKYVFYITGMSFLLKFYYVFCTEIYTRQHDFSQFGRPEGTGGHAGYIEYLLNHHHLANADPRTIYGFYHPPLHFFLSASWMEIHMKVLGVDFNRAAESLQTLTLFYSMVITIIACRIFRFFKLEGKALYAALLFVAFHPTFVILSGSVNNDILSIAFMAGAVLCTLNWYREQNLKNILKIALCVGFGMMTKISAALVAPPIAIVFLAVFIKNIRTRAMTYIWQYLAFGTVCIPLGLWYGIRNYVKWKVPFTYVQEIPVEQAQYLGNETVFQRIFDFSPSQFSSVYEQWLVWNPDGTTKGYNEHNPLIVILKNSLFGEFIKDDTFKTIPWVNFVSFVLFWTASLCALVSVIFMIVLCVKKKETDFREYLFLGITFFTMIIGYYRTAFAYPFVCTMDFRYIPFTVVIGALFYGIFMQSELKKKIAFQVFFYTAVLFSVCSSVIMTAVCMV